MFGFNFAPAGWALADGQLLPIAQNAALFSVLVAHDLRMHDSDAGTSAVTAYEGLAGSGSARRNPATAGARAGLKEDDFGGAGERAARSCGPAAHPAGRERHTS
jgi:hypothetical protein